MHLYCRHHLDAATIALRTRPYRLSVYLMFLSLYCFVLQMKLISRFFSFWMWISFEFGCHNIISWGFWFAVWGEYDFFWLVHKFVFRLKFDWIFLMLFLYFCCCCVFHNKSCENVKKGQITKKKQLSQGDMENQKWKKEKFITWPQGYMLICNWNVVLASKPLVLMHQGYLADIMGG